MRKAIISGASSGLGYEIASQLAERGVDVVNLSRNPCDVATVNIKTDLRKNADIAAALEAIRSKHSDADLLVLCSGVLHLNAVGEMKTEEIDADFAVNITSALKLTDGIMPILRENKGDIVVVGSTSAFKCYPETAVYNATKHGLLGLIKTLQVELKNEDVRIIGFHPGGFRSKLHIKAGSDIRQEELMDPKDLAKLLISLLELPRTMEVSEVIINRKVTRS